MECPHLTLYGKTPIKGLIGLGNSKLPWSINGLRVFETDASLLMLILWVLGIVPVILKKKLIYLEKGWTGIHHEVPCYTHRGVDKIVATVCSHIKITLFRISPLARKQWQRLTSMLVYQNWSMLGTTFLKYKRYAHSCGKELWYNHPAQFRFLRNLLAYQCPAAKGVLMLNHWWDVNN